MKYFTLEELLQSDVALRNSIDNLPPKFERAEVYCNLTALVDNLLDPIREKFAAPLIITSGYRTEELNALVGGACNSQHMTGEAVDFYLEGFSKMEMAGVFFEISVEFDFDQLIYYKKNGFIHMSYSRSKNRDQAFVR